MPPSNRVLNRRPNVDGEGHRIRISSRTYAVAMVRLVATVLLSAHCAFAGASSTFRLDLVDVRLQTRTLSQVYLI